jgi:spermidine synthase
MQFFNRYFLYLTLFIIGAVIMVIEIAGTRILAPFYGATIYVWSSLITVTMACLALGYFLGGWWADKKPPLKNLYLIILLSSLIIVFIPKIDSWVLLRSADLGMIWGPLLATFILFSLPLLLLAMATPLAIKIRIKILDNLGVNAGSLYAISTFGSLVGAILSGFWLIPNFGIIKILNFTALVLLLIVIFWFLLNRKLFSLFLAIIVTLILFLLPGFQKAALGKSELVFQSPSFYGEIKVVDQDDRRYLLIDGITQSGIDKNSGQSVLAYTDSLQLAWLLVPNINKALIIGLGGGLIPKELSQRGVIGDIVEIDPRVKEVALNFFDFPADKFNLYFTDGRYYINQTSNQYDLIIIDAYGGEQIPGHLFSYEAFKEVSQKLTADGVLVINTHGFLNSRFSQSLYLTLKQIFPEVIILAGNKDAWSNIIFYSGHNLPRDLAEAVEKNCLNQECRDLYKDILRTDLVDLNLNKEAKILTDNYNPIQFWQIEASQAFREWVWEFFGRETFIN